MLCCVGRMWLATVTFYSLRKSIRGVHVSHAIGLVSCGGLASVVALAQRCGLAELVADKLTRTAKGSVNAHLKVPALIPAMVAGADLIGDMDLLRPGGMDRLFTGNPCAVDVRHVLSDLHLRPRPAARQHRGESAHRARGPDPAAGWRGSEQLGR